MVKNGSRGFIKIEVDFNSILMFIFILIAVILEILIWKHRDESGMGFSLFQWETKGQVEFSRSERGLVGCVPIIGYEYMVKHKIYHGRCLYMESVGPRDTLPFNFEWPNNICDYLISKHPVGSVVPISYDLDHPEKSKLNINFEDLFSADHIDFLGNLRISVFLMSFVGLFIVISGVAVPFLVCSLFFKKRQIKSRR